MANPFADWLCSKMAKKKAHLGTSPAPCCVDNSKPDYDRMYKDWNGDHHTANSCHPVHDSAEAIDFAQYCVKEIYHTTLDRRTTLQFCNNQPSSSHDVRQPPFRN